MSRLRVWVIVWGKVKGMGTWGRVKENSLRRGIPENDGLSIIDQNIEITEELRQEYWGRGWYWVRAK